MTFQRLILTFLLFCFLSGIHNGVFAQDNALYSFDIEEFEKKTWEWKGEIFLMGSGKAYYKNSVLYPIKFQNEEIDKSQEIELNLSFESRWDWNGSRLMLSGEISVLRSSIVNNNDELAFLGEGYWQTAHLDPYTLEIGKRLLRWGKGYAFNPVALMERTKNPEDPESSREGLWMTQCILISGNFSFFESSSVTWVYLPVREEVNSDFQANLIHENLWGLKLYGLTGTTDIDFYLVRWTEEAKTDWGLDFSSNISANFEIHGEISFFDPDEQMTLLGLRYLTKNEITLIMEVYRDSSGLTKSESIQLYETIGNLDAFEAKQYWAKIQQKKTLSQNYGYLKISLKEPFNWLYFTSSFSWLGNLDDGSSNNTVQFAYSPSDNWSFLLNLQHLQGNQYTQYGEGIINDKLELSAGYSF